MPVLGQIWLFLGKKSFFLQEKSKVLLPKIRKPTQAPCSHWFLVGHWTKCAKMVISGHWITYYILSSMVMISSEEEVSLSEGKKNGLFRLHLIRAQNKMCQRGIYQRVLYPQVLLFFIFYILQQKGVLVIRGIIHQCR